MRGGLAGDKLLEAGWLSGRRDGGGEDAVRAGRFGREGMYGVCR